MMSARTGAVKFSCLFHTLRNVKEIGKRYLSIPTEGSKFQRPFPRAFSALSPPHLLRVRPQRCRPRRRRSLQMSMCYFPNGRRRRGRPLENEAATERERGREGTHLCFMPLYLLQMFSDTINSAVPFFRRLKSGGRGNFLVHI